MFAIWFLSGRPGEDIPLPGGWDKPMHFAEYAFLGYFLSIGLGVKWPRWLLALLLAAGYGIVDEYHQFFVPGRFPSGADILMDAVGAAAGVWFGSKRKRARGGRSWNDRTSLR